MSCFKVEKLDIDNFVTDNLREMSSMFYECNSLTSLNLKILKQKK